MAWRCLLASTFVVLTTGCSQIASLRPLPGAQQIDRGVAQLQAGHPDRADVEFQKALKVGGGDYRVSGEVAQKCAENREWNLAIRYGEQALKQTPTTDKLSRTGLFSLLATASLGQRDTGAAVRYAKAGFQENPEDPAAMNLLGYTYADAPIVEKLGDALDLTQKAVSAATQEGQPDEVIALYLDSLGWVKYQQGKVDEAVADLTRAAYTLPRIPEVLYHLGMAYMKKARYADAIVVLERAVKLAPRDSRMEQALKESIEKLPPKAVRGQSISPPSPTAGPPPPSTIGGAVLPAPHP